jgi:GTP pyrophosphokinase
MAGSEPAYGDRVSRALVVAAEMHAGQVRRGTTIPYLSHLLGTCAIALEFGADEDQAIAALLHDMIEDVRPTEAARAEVAAFGPEVLRIVEACTDAETHPKPPWRERKVRYIAHLAKADAAVLLVSASDKLHNARAIASDLHRVGPAVFERFNADADTLWYYRSLVTEFRANPASNADLVDELDRTVTEMERLASGGGPPMIEHHIIPVLRTTSRALGMPAADPVIRRQFVDQPAECADSAVG